MSSNKIYTAPKSLELENFVYNPIAVINVCPTLFLIYREEHQIEVIWENVIVAISPRYSHFFIKNISVIENNVSRNVICSLI